MDTSKVTSWWDQVQPILVAFGLKAIGAVVVFHHRPLAHQHGHTRDRRRHVTRQRVDPTVQRYLVSFISVALNIILVEAILRVNERTARAPGPDPALGRISIRRCF